MVIHLIRADASVVMEVSQDWEVELPITDDNLVTMEPTLRHAMADAMLVLAGEMKHDAGYKTVSDTQTLEVIDDQPMEWKKTYEA